ncbi:MULTISPECIES: hypothetical protein [unclassified Oleiphilus]|uniref:hypothetical protein n=1 Tax=unclassified Oleiphilus TaxID=2631174 RepID=UPI0007C40B60|nr:MULTISPECIES: hypothetical protein [unclassified Oleiphilus]KZY70715.1 hypothetical protein A3738_03955 [Oleiphilus sp. HI0066]MCH2158296.1 hypothetical protein [Oleiphilaceae bacterium]
MQSYQIIDEPKPRAYENLVADPLAIFFVCMFVPFLWVPPLLGKYWIPPVWLLLNSFFMGSPTFKKELLIVVLGIIGLFSLFFGFGVLANLNGQEVFKEQFGPYLRVLAQAGFFFTLYLLVSKQARPYEIHKYLKEQAAN